MPAGIGGCGWPGLGVSYDSRTAVREEIIERAPRTIALAVGAAIIWLIMGVSIGVLSALRRRHDLRTARPWASRSSASPRRSSGSASPALYIFRWKLGFEALGTGYVPFSESPAAGSRT